MTATPTIRAQRGWRLLPMAAVACALLVACATPPATVAGATFVVVRHAEKAPGGDDPPLSEAGRARAQSLAADLRTTPLVAAYATGFRRTRDTAAPSAAAHRLELRSYDADAPATGLARQLRRDHDHGTVLVVGHSNTVPDIVSALCACTVTPIDETVYGGRYDIRIGGDGRAVLVQGRF